MAQKHADLFRHRAERNHASDRFTPLSHAIEKKCISRLRRLWVDEPVGGEALPADDIESRSSAPWPKSPPTLPDGKSRVEIVQYSEV